MGVILSQHAVSVIGGRNGIDQSRRTVSTAMIICGVVRPEGKLG
jgi:hypothetical protein